MDSKEMIKKVGPATNTLMSNAKDQIKNTVSKFNIKDKASMLNFVDLKLSLLRVIINKKINDLAYIKESFKKSRDDKINEITEFLGDDHKKKSILAIVLFAIDFVLEFILIKAFVLIIPRFIGLLLIRAFDKVVELVNKKQSKQIVVKPTILDKIKKIPRAVKNRVVKKINNVKEVYHNILGANPPTIEELNQDESDGLVGRNILAVSLASAICEETSKSVSEKLNILKYYTGALVTLESIIYLSKGTEFKQRIPSIVMHIVTSIMHKIPKIKNYTYLVHLGFNIIMSYVFYKQSKGK